MAPFKNDTTVVESLNRIYELINESPQEIQDMIFTLLTDLKNLPHKKSLTKKVDDAGIFEARGATSDNWIRLFWFWHKKPGENKKIVVTHGYLKDQNKTDPNEIKTAKRIKKQYEEYKIIEYKNKGGKST